MPVRGGVSRGEVGQSGLNRSTLGTIDEEYVPSLQGRKALEVYREMGDNDPTVGAVLFAIRMLCRQVEWNVEEHPDAANAEEDAKFVEECMQDMSHTWADHISEVMSMIQFGWSWFETVYKQRQGYQPEGAQLASSRFNDGRIGWRKFAFRSQDSLEKWQFDDQGGLQAMVQKPPPKFEEIVLPIQKSLLFRTDTTKNNPEGRSLLRVAYRPWYFKKNVEEMEGIGVERDLAGLPVAEVDPAILREDAEPEEKALYNRIEQIVRNIKRNREEGVVWPVVYDDAGNKMYDLKLLNSGGSRQYDTNAIITRWDQRIAMTVLADFILLGHEKVGSFALSSDKTDLFAVALGALLDSVQEVYNRFAIPRLFELNGLDTEFLPSIKHGDIEDPILTDVIAYVQGLVSAGVPLFPDEQLENHLRKIGHLPEKSEEAQEEQDAAREDQPDDAPDEEDPELEEVGL